MFQYYIFVRVCVCTRIYIKCMNTYTYTHFYVFSCREIELNYLKLIRAFYYRIV